MPSSPPQVWFADEVCIGQKNKITRCWAGARHASERADGPTNWPAGHIFGVYSVTGAGKPGICPDATLEAMNLALMKSSAQIASMAHCWALSSIRPAGICRVVFAAPPNITLILLLAKWSGAQSAGKLVCWFLWRDNHSQTGIHPTTTSSTMARLGTTSSINPGGIVIHVFAQIAGPAINQSGIVRVYR